MSNDTEQARAALAELVALHDLRAAVELWLRDDATGRQWPAMPTAERDAAAADHKRRLPLAIANARAALAHPAGASVQQEPRHALEPLINEQLDALAMDEDGLPNSHLEFARAIELAHGIAAPNEGLPPADDKPDDPWALTLALCMTHGLCVGKDMHGRCYVGEQGCKPEEALMWFEEGDDPKGAVLKAVTKVAWEQLTGDSE